MRNKLAAVLLLLAGAVQAATLSVKDDLGNTVQLAQPAQRVVALTPHATELVAALALQRLVGIDAASNYPPAVAGLPKIGRFDTVNVEAIVALKPDLVIAWEGTAMQRSLQPLARLGIPVFYSKPQTPADVADNLLRLGKLLGADDAARAQAGKLQADYAALKARYRGAAPVRVFMQVNAQPLLTISDLTFLGQAIKDCGGVNAYAAAGVTVPQASAEAVLAFAPQLLVATGKVDGLAGWRRHAALPAVQKGQLYGIADDRLVRPGPRLVQGVQLLCDRIDAARQVFTQPKPAK
ncbi:vitamin B12 transport system substrate-binding protein [Andreprevotia lacus DSM 23236]|jgi:ABC-type Fe3+-hydroxamate transport system substrate-binding protein|uniref:Vitamin B12 transport system substrate-binding protein n=1 Tax=Andreprevotia lacus DSM 23236 TaxID=1121001 RepID=A0A1W1XC99_9NEIS|nr:helical backbone metal receptor [Andreprevotia lacus]SMC21151.1 vitamin B12 transport system substrate-binding protein [Andreprevotia lacus DSM 23236]